MEQMLRRTWAEINLDALTHNFKTLQQRVGEKTKLVGVVKADAYGHGALQVSRTLEELGAGYLAVSNLDEARELRTAGISMPILILGHTPEQYVPQLLEYDITQAVTCEAKALAYNNMAKACGKKLRVHIKVDTGMCRLGFLCADGHFASGVEGILRSCDLPWLEAEGIFTHFAVSDEPEKPESVDYTKKQFRLFMDLIGALEARGRTFPLRHCANSGAVVNYPEEMALDMVRPGIILYGCGAGSKELGLKPVMSLKTTVSTIKILDKGWTVSYGRMYEMPKDTRMGVLPIGYADGLFRALSNRCSFYVGGVYLPQRGRICMDMCMLDLSDAPWVDVGDEVEIFGPHNRVDKLAELAGTISYELTCAVSKRVPRVFLRKKKVVGRELRMYL